MFPVVLIEQDQEKIPLAIGSWNLITKKVYVELQPPSIVKIVWC